MKDSQLFSNAPAEAKYTVEEMHDKIVSYLTGKTLLFEDSIKPKCSIYRDLGLDSLDKVELVMWCEVEFRVAIPDHEMEKIDTIEDLFRAVESKGRWLDC